MAIVLKNVSYKHSPYDKEYFLSNVNLEIDDNKICGIIGKSGSGKTTLLEILGGINKPTDGEVLINYVDINKEDYRKNIGIVFQFPEEQFFEIDVKREIEFAAKNYHVKRKKLKEVLKVVGLEDNILTRKLDSLSNGEKRLIAIASVLIYNPKVILFDEPTIGLDYKNKKKIINLIKDLKNRYDKTIIIVSHDIDLLYLMCDDLIILSNGKIILYGDVDSVFNEIDILKKYNIQIPRILKFTNYLKDKKNIILLPCKTINDLIKEVYRNV